VALFHLQSYDNHWSRISMQDSQDDDDEYGHYNTHDDDHTEGFRAVPHPLSSSLISLSSSSGVYLEDDEDEDDRQHPYGNNHRNINNHYHHQDVGGGVAVATDRRAPRTTTVTAGNGVATAAADCGGAQQPLSSATATTPTATTRMPSVTTSGDTVLTTKAMYDLDDVVADLQCYRDLTDANNEDSDLHISCVIENRKAQLFCRSFAEQHSNEVVVNTPVCMGVCGLRIIQEPYCRLYSVVEYKIKVIINHQSYFVWKRYEDFVRFSVSCKRMIYFYNHQHQSLCSDTSSSTSSSSATAAVTANWTLSKDISSMSVRCCAPAVYSTSFSHYYHNQHQLQQQHCHLRGTLGAWKAVEAHRPWWWFQPTSWTKFAQEESVLLEDFLKNLLFEVPNMQLISELIM
jgi:hypothetical protein